MSYYEPKAVDEANGFIRRFVSNKTMTPFRDGYRSIIPLKLDLISDELVEQLHADAQKIARMAAPGLQPLARMYARTVKGQTVYVWVGKPYFYIYVNLDDLIPVHPGDSNEPRAHYIAESLCR